jgi:hypothetical protein
MSTQNIFDLTDTWGDVGTTFTAIKMNVTDTASASGSLLIDLQVGGTSQFRVTKAGQVNLVSGSTSVPTLNFSAAGAGIYGRAGNAITMTTGGVNFFDAQQVGVTIRNVASYNFSNNGDASSSPDLRLFRDAANTLAQRDGVNAQTTRVYSTYTSATNFQRMAISSARVTLSALSGASATATALIPDGAVVVGVTARVTTEITGSTGFLIGTAGDPDRWGDITGTAVGTTSDNTNWTAGTVECFTSATDVVISEKTAAFTAGAIEIAIHYLRGEAD